MKDSFNYALKDVEKKYVKIIQNFKKGIQEVFGMKKMINISFFEGQELALDNISKKK